MTFSQHVDAIACASAMLHLLDLHNSFEIELQPPGIDRLGPSPHHLIPAPQQARPLRQRVVVLRLYASQRGDGARPVPI